VKVEGKKMDKKILKDKIMAKGMEITVLSVGSPDDFISITDIARYKNPEFPADVVKNWLRTRAAIEFNGIWEQIHNPNFKLVEFDQFKNESGANAFVLSPQKWIESTNAIGMISRSGRGGGTFAHIDIAFEFASWISAEFKLYIIKDYQRLKSDENSRLSLDWNVRRILTKINYRIHTDAIKENLIPPELTARQKSNVYANEADLLNTVLFGISAYEWRKKNPKKDGNMRDYATIEQLLVLANLENVNALFIEQGMPQAQRMDALYDIAKSQLSTITRTSSLMQMKSLEAKGRLAKTIVDREEQQDE
jgi:hypothetical protein